MATANHSLFATFSIECFLVKSTCTSLGVPEATQGKGVIPLVGRAIPLVGQQKATKVLLSKWHN